MYEYRIDLRVAQSFNDDIVVEHNSPEFHLAVEVLPELLDQLLALSVHLGLDGLDEVPLLLGEVIGKGHFNAFGPLLKESAHLPAGELGQVLVGAAHVDLVGLLLPQVPLDEALKPLLVLDLEFRQLQDHAADEVGVHLAPV